jgi:hypothetical protein
MKTNRISYFLLLALFSGCTQEVTDKDTIDFNRTDFKQYLSLHDPEEIETEELLDPVSFHLMHDSIVIVQNQAHCDYLIELYSLNTRRIVAKLASKGNAPGEVTSSAVYVISNTAPSFTLKDENIGIFYEINLDSTLISKQLCIQEKFRYASEIRQNSEIFRLDSEHYIGYNMWYLDDPNYANKVSALQMYPINDEHIKPYNLTDYSYFVAPVNDAHLYFNSSNKETWLIDGHRDKITIYDDSLRMIRTITGPDHYEPVYKTQEANIPMPFITFHEEKYYGTYLGYTVTDQYIYFIYQGINGGTYDVENLQPVEIIGLLSTGSICLHHFC